MSIRLYSTLSRRLEELPPPPGPIRMYVCGSTVYQRVARRQLAAVRARDVAAALAARARLRGHARPQHHRRQRQRSTRRRRSSARAAASSPARRREWYLEDTGDLGLGLPDVEPRATETIPEIVAFIERADRRGHGVRVARATSTSASPRYPDYGQLSGAAARRHGRAGAEPAEGGSARLRTLEGAEAARGRRRGTRRGGPAGRAGTSSARRWPRSTSARASRSTAAGSTSSSHTTRTSSPSRARAATRSRRSGCTTGCSSSATRRCRSRSGNVVTLRNVLDTWGRETAAALPHERALAEAGRLHRRDAGAGADAGWQASANALALPERDAAGATGRSSRQRSRTTSTRRPRSRCCIDGASRGARDLLARGLDLFGLADASSRCRAEIEELRRGARRLAAAKDWEAADCERATRSTRADGR